MLEIHIPTFFYMCDANTIWELPWIKQICFGWTLKHRISIFGWQCYLSYLLGWWSVTGTKPSASIFLDHPQVSMEVHWNPIFTGGRGVTKNQYVREDCLKMRVWKVCRFKRGWCFFRGVWYPNAHYDWYFPINYEKDSWLTGLMKILFLTIS